MSVTMRKAVSEIISKLKKIPEPGKKTGSFWDFMRSQLMEEGQWEQKHINVIEKEIDVYISKIEKKTLLEMWKATPQGEEKFDNEEKIDTKEMKADVTEEMIGQVMDRMDENYSSRDSTLPPQNDSYAISAKETEEADNEEESIPKDISDEEIDIDDDIFNEDVEEEDDDFKF